MKKQNKLTYHNINLNSMFMANYILKEYLNGNIISLETKIKEINKMKSKDFMKIMKNIELENSLVAYQGPEKML